MQAVADAAERTTIYARSFAAQRKIAASLSALSDKSDAAAPFKAPRISAMEKLAPTADRGEKALANELLSRAKPKKGSCDWYFWKIHGFCCNLKEVTKGFHDQ